VNSEFARWCRERDPCRFSGGGGGGRHLVGLGADVGLRVFETRDGAVAEAAHHGHQRVEVLQLQQLLWTREGGGGVPGARVGRGDRPTTTTTKKGILTGERRRHSLAFSSPQNRIRSALPTCYWMLQRVFVNPKIILCEWHSTGLPAALQPAWHPRANQWSRSWGGGSCDVIQLKHPLVGKAVWKAARHSHEDG